MNCINLDFCIIENPLDKNKNPIIFVTKCGKDYLDESIIYDEDYEKLISIIQKMGYIESDMLTFEFSQDPDYPSILSKEIKKELENNGMKYSKNLEKSIKCEFEKINIEGAKLLIKDLEKESKKQTSKQFSKYRIPQLGEKITLFFYLFVECKFVGDKCYVNLNGDFSSEENSSLRNYISTIKCDFVRIGNTQNPNKIMFKSCKTDKEISKNIPIDYSGSFILKTKDENYITEKNFVYYFMEIKNNLPQQSRISIEIDSPYNFNEMIKLSKKIKTQYKLSQKKEIDINKTSEHLLKIKKILNDKMLSFAEKEEYEKAIYVKKDIKSIENKIEKIETLGIKTIAVSQFIKKFYIK